MQVHRQVELLETDAVQSPALYGLFRLQLLLPKGMSDGFNEAELRHIFLHELAHVKRGDMWLNWLVTGLQIIHWFNPVIWFAFARLRADRELACDELALIHSGETQGQYYGQTILKLLENISQAKATPGLVGIVEDRSQMAQRLRRIAAFRLPTKWSWAAVLLVLGLSLIGLTGAQTPTPAKPVETRPPVISQLQITTNSQLRVRVFDNQSGQPLSGVKVSTGKTSVTTDQAGYALVSKPEVSEKTFMYEVRVRRSGYVAREIKWSSFQQDKRADVPAEYTVRLDRGRTIGGYVRDETGKGIADAVVEISGPSKVGIPPREFPLGSSSRFHTEKTDVNGFWTFDQAPVKFEDLYFTLIHPDFLRAGFRIDNANVPSAGAVKLRMADLAATNAIITLTRGAKLSGQIVDRSGQPISGVTITMNRDWGRSQFIFTNDANGRFEIRNASGPSILIPDLPANSMLLTLQAEGYASKAEVIDLSALPKEVKIAMSPGKVLRGQLVNQDGQALTNGHVRSDEYRFSSATDAQGRFIWSSAPEEPVTLWVSAPGHMPQRISPWVADGKERKIVLTPLIKTDGPRVVKGRVMDADSKQPVTYFTAQWEAVPSQASSRTPLPFSSDTGSYRIASATDLNRLTVTFSASGYETQSVTLTGPKLKQEQDVFLQKGEDYKGMILLPDGKPGAGASLVFATARNPARLGKHRFETYSGPPPLDVDGKGAFQHPQVGGCRAIAAVHAQGFALVDIEAFKQNPVIQLQAWGRIEGTLRIGEKMGVGHKLWLQPLVAATISEQPELSGAVFATVSDEAGRFVFDFVPSGEFKVVRVVSSGPETPVKDPSDRASVIASSHAGSFSHGTLVAVAPGENVKLTMGGKGTAVRGKVLPPSGVMFDWTTMDLAAELKGPPIPWPWVAEKRSPAVGESVAFIRSKEYRTARRESKNYAFAVKTDGTIEISDVPPGTYTLELRAERKLVEPMSLDGPLKSNTPRVVGMLTKEVVIPEKIPAGVSPVDLGELVLSRPAAPAPTSPKTNAKQTSTAEKQPMIAREVPSSVVTAKPASVTNAPLPVFKGKVLDAATRQPVTNFTLIQRASAPPIAWKPKTMDYRSETGRFDSPVQKTAKIVKASFSATGYKVKDLELTVASLEHEHEVFLDKVEVSAGRVILPNGKPAAGAFLAFRSPKHPIVFGVRRFESYSRNSLVVDANGAFDQIPEADCDAIAAVHDAGVAIVSMDDFRKNPVIQLQKWGRLEGTLRVGEKLGAGRQVSLHQGVMPFPNPTDPVLQYSAFRTATDENGKFAFESVPPGEFLVSVSGLVSPTNSFPRYYLSTHTSNFVIHAGETASIVIGGKGLRITGHAALKDQQFDWRDTYLYASLNSVIARPPAQVAAGDDSNGYFRSKEYRETLRAQHNHGFAVSENGAIEAVDVLPGKYRLIIRAKRNETPGKNVPPSQFKLIGSLEKEIVIPEPVAGKPAMFDLGDLVLLP